MTATPDCFALLDDCDASAAAPRSRLYTGYLRSYQAYDAASLQRLLDTLQQDGGHAVALFAYELGAVLQGLSVTPAPGAEGADKPQTLAQVLVFARCDHLSADAVARWLAARDEGAAAGVANLTPELDQAGFTSMVEQIRAYIAAGDTYQVNATFRLRFDAYGTPLALYRRLRERQPVPYGALIALPDRSSVLSLSPELFVAHGARTLTARPMKGTARALGDVDADARTAAQLAADPKNRAENLMIVDLLRNDLGRVAVTGSVAVPELFHVTRYGDVLQMTSTVTAQLRDGLSLAQVVAALFPCGSITGAPKRRTMQIIAELETSPRGLYTGAIGWFDRPTSPNTARAVGDFCLSVPIRTLLLQAPGADGLRRGEMGIGAGIVHDSVAAEEWAECALKAQFLRAMPPQFTLFETMAITRSGGCALLSRHLDRLQHSARVFGFTYDRAAVLHHVENICAGLADAYPYRLRLTLHPDGSCTSECAAMTALAQPVRLLLAASQTDADDLFLQHKTSLRALYDTAWRAAEAAGAFDQIFCNQHGDVTEGGRSSLFARIDGDWVTPPLSAGVLPGVQRAAILADPAWSAREVSLTIADLRRAEQLMVCNALRGALVATLVESIADAALTG